MHGGFSPCSCLQRETCQGDFLAEGYQGKSHVEGEEGDTVGEFVHQGDYVLHTLIRLSASLMAKYWICIGIIAARVILSSLVSLPANAGHSVAPRMSSWFGSGGRVTAPRPDRDLLGSGRLLCSVNLLSRLPMRAKWRACYRLDY